MLCLALGDRAKLVRVLVQPGTPATESVLQGIEIKIGIILHPIQSLRLVDRGPQLITPTFKGAFSLFWGNRSERRQFDGIWYESVLWADEGIVWDEGKRGNRGRDDILWPSRGRRRSEWALQYALKRWLFVQLPISIQLSLNESVEGFEKEDNITIKKEDKQMSVEVGVKDQDNNSIISKAVKRKRNQETDEQQKDQSIKYKKKDEKEEDILHVNESQLRSSNIHTNKRKRIRSYIRSIQSLPLRFMSVHALHPVIYDSDPVSLLAHPLAGAPKIKSQSQDAHTGIQSAISNKQFLFAKGIPVLIRTERSSRWPNTQRALQLLKEMITLKLGDTLSSSSQSSKSSDYYQQQQSKDENQKIQMVTIGRGFIDMKKKDQLKVRPILL
ncbi:MAG: hypothetical protein EZS28_042326 [Streblomastix strix]|uniref:Uncharacterized protein n=1 Tax=Streblomastix strix TaxID=222440 RepID=A0A5J4TV37_9EUKA|nr:MAG: hypothetical protein EZS28_042326 [Streblomastix strix]